MAINALSKPHKYPAHLQLVVHFGNLVWMGILPVHGLALGGSAGAWLQDPNALLYQIPVFNNYRFRDTGFYY